MTHKPLDQQATALWQRLPKERRDAWALIAYTVAREMGLKGKHVPKAR